MLIKVLDELILVDYIYRVGKIHCSNECEDYGNKFIGYKFSLTIYFLNKKEFSFSISTRFMKEAFEIEKKVEKEMNDFIKGDPKHEWEYNYLEKEKAKELKMLYHEPLKNEINKHFENLISFLSDSIQECHKSNNSLIKGYDFPNNYNFLINYS